MRRRLHGRYRGEVTESISLSFNNDDFYTADGRFNEEAAKDAVITLMKYYNYPVTDKTRGSIWVGYYLCGSVQP